MRQTVQVLETTPILGDLNADWISLAIATLAVVVAVWSAWYTVSVTRETSRHSLDETRKSAKAETYQRLHETLVDPQAARGRRILFLATRRGQFPSLGEPDWDDINYSLALYDTLGGYVFQGLIDEQMAVRAWHHPLQDIHSPVVAFMEHRTNNGVNQPWSFLLDLLDKADRYECDCPRQPGVTAATARGVGSLTEDALPQIDHA